ncbi:MAG: hypothetical protein AAF710_06855 [Planctomycetota bacterium]
MEETPPPPPASLPPAARRVPAWVFGLPPVAVVVAAAAVYLAWSGDASDLPLKQTEAEAIAGPVFVTPGRDYYVFVRTVELYPQRPDGKAWDRVGGRAPDIRYRLTWRGQAAFTSGVRDNALVGLWDPIGVDVAEALPLVGDGRVELASLLNRGLVLNATADASLVVEVWDHDGPGLPGDAAGRFELPVDTLRMGDQTLRREASADNAVKRLILRVTGTDQPAQNLLEALGQP